MNDIVEILQEDVRNASNELNALWTEEIAPRVEFLNEEENNIIKGKVTKLIIREVRTVKTLLKRYKKDAEGIRTTINESQEANLNAFSGETSSIYSFLLESCKNLSQEWLSKFEELITV